MANPTHWIYYHADLVPRPGSDIGDDYVAYTKQFVQRQAGELRRIVQSQ